MTGIIQLNESDFDEITTLLKKEQSRKVTVRFNRFFNNIQFFNYTGLDLYLRSSANKYITIVRISLPKKRKGTCTRLVEILAKYAKEKGFKGVEIESVCTPEMNEFCKKNNFIQEKYDGSIETPGWYGNYYLND